MDARLLFQRRAMSFTGRRHGNTVATFWQSRAISGKLPPQWSCGRYLLWAAVTPMNLRLASSGDERALAIRDHLLPLIRERGALENQRGAVRLIVLETGDWTVNHWTPFSDLSSGEASSPGYRHAVERQHTRLDLPYGLEVWRGSKVLSILWSDDGSFKVVTFVRGSWEDDALKL